MKRREFIVNSCNACLAAGTLGTVFSACRTMHSVAGHLNTDGVLVDIDEFKVSKGDQTAWRSYIIVRNDHLKFPICIYRFGESDYSAIWMQCAHQGAEVQVAGSYLHCPAHGSEYDNRGRVTNGPATNDLRSFPVTASNNQLFIDLRKK